MAVLRVRAVNRIVVKPGMFNGNTGCCLKSCFDFCSAVVTSSYRNCFHRTAEVLAIVFGFKHSPWKIIQWKRNVEDLGFFVFF